MRHPARMRISAGKSTGTCANWRRSSLRAPAALPIPSDASSSLPLRFGSAGLVCPPGLIRRANSSACREHSPAADDGPGRVKPRALGFVAAMGFSAPGGLKPCLVTVGPKRSRPSPYSSATRSLPTSRETMEPICSMSSVSLIPYSFSTASGLPPRSSAEEKWRGRTRRLRDRQERVVQPDLFEEGRPWGM